jgi:hypothetical protein
MPPARDAGTGAVQIAGGQNRGCAKTELNLERGCCLGADYSCRHGSPSGEDCARTRERGGDGDLFAEPGNCGPVAAHQGESLPRI